MIRIAQFLTILFWEMFENAPLLIGFIMAIRLWDENLWLALACLLLGAGLGAGLIHFTESKKFSNQPALKETLVNFAVFTLLPIPFVFYLSAKDVWWSNWIVDIAFGIIAGGALSIGESWGWKDKSTIKIHIVSMAIAIVLLLWGIRFTTQTELLTSILIVGIILNCLVSIIIVFFDYWPITTILPKTKSSIEAEIDDHKSTLMQG